jgi:hypothetical protein
MLGFELDLSFLQDCIPLGLGHLLGFFSFSCRRLLAGVCV